MTIPLLFRRQKPAMAIPLPLHSLAPEQMTAAFAVKEDQLQWRATHQAITNEIMTCLRAAQDLTLNPQACACEVAAIEHLHRLAETLRELREAGLKTG